MKEGDQNTIPAFAGMPEKFQLLFLLAMTDWSKFVKVCGKLVKTSEIGFAVEKYLEHSLIDVREAAQYLRLLCGGSFKLCFLDKCARSHKTHLRALVHSLRVPIGSDVSGKLPGDWNAIACDQRGNYSAAELYEARRRMLLTHANLVLPETLMTWVSQPIYASGRESLGDFLDIAAMAEIVLSKRGDIPPRGPDWHQAHDVLDAFKNN